MHLISWRRRAIATLLSTALGTCVVGITTRPAYAAGCHWRVTWGHAGVYRNPDRNSTVLKVKDYGDIVGEYCYQYYSNGENWTPVACQCSPTGQGWMRSGALSYVGYY